MLKRAKACPKDKPKFFDYSSGCNQVLMKGWDGQEPLWCGASMKARVREPHI